MLGSNYKPMLYIGMRKAFIHVRYLCLSETICIQRKVTAEAYETSSPWELKKF